MIELNGKYNVAKVFTDNVEASAMSQIIELCNQKFAAESKIRIMSDVHAGAGCTIGTTMTISDKVVPNLVGVDIGCGVSVIKLFDKEIDFEKLDKVIRAFVPSGFSVHQKVQIEFKEIENLKCAKYVNLDRAYLSIGSLGGGNHFIEVAKDEDSNLYLLIHSGSRNLGKEVAVYYQGIAEKSFLNVEKEDAVKVISELKKSGRHLEIESYLKSIKVEKPSAHLEYLEGENFSNYIHDMKIVQKFASLNRKTISDIILKKMDVKGRFFFDTVHNYIDIDEMILRKGAVSAKWGEKLIIPINMRDGSLLCVGRGNAEWNNSAPHGAGRILSRGKAKEKVTFEEFENSMKDVWTTSVKESTIDESPMAYKNIDEIISNIGDTVVIAGVIKPVYNFKA